MPKQPLTSLPMLSYDELTVLCSALAAQVVQDVEILCQARSPEITDALAARVAIDRSLLTACLEARELVEPDGQPELELLRALWDQPETRTAAWRT